MADTEKKKENKILKRIYPVIFMFLLTVVFISILTAVNLLTKEQIEFNEEIRLQSSIMYTAGIEIPESKDRVTINEKEDLVEIIILNDNNKKENYRIVTVKNKNNEFAYYEVYYENEFISYVFMPTGAGLWGEITALIGFSGNLETITGLDFVKQSETPGLGARITEDWFKEQFIGKDGPVKFSGNGKMYDTVGEKEKSKTNQFSAITGATITSNYVKKIINNTISEAKKILQDSK